MANDTILVIGASGQIGTELVMELRNKFGHNNVVASDVKEPQAEVKESGPFEPLNILDKEQLFTVIKKHQVQQVYLLAALLSATAEQKPMLGWELNMDGLFNVLELAREGHIAKVFWPSSIAIFGPTTPRVNTPQYTIAEPTTVYGISKLAGERWCEYYYNKYGVDVRGVRYPGLISYKSPPGGGTTDYAIDIFYGALENNRYTCFLSEEATLPMMYMPDALDATINIMEAPASHIEIRSSYNISGVSFSPREIAAEIAKHQPGFSVNYAPDYRNEIAQTWPQSIDDTYARKHWGWAPQFDLEAMTHEMLKNLAEKTQAI